ncbi:MAG: hypothetical protein C5B44_06735 [Acidobacteria bacterium]|nr:MAG: hypothetical protein C5B44_06735 [Acidobacteriota bacterium]
MGKALKKEQDCIRYLVHERLRSRSKVNAASSDPHLDDDTVAAFLEARLTEEESGPVIAHLVACGSCRRLTAQLVSFDSNVDDSYVDTGEREDQGSLRQWFEDFKAGLSSSNEEVFAYQNPPETEDSQSPTQEPPTPPDTDKS